MTPTERAQLVHAWKVETSRGNLDEAKLIAKILEKAVMEPDKANTPTTPTAVEKMAVMPSRTQEEALPEATADDETIEPIKEAV